MDFITSDWHLGHARILELCDRPFEDVDHMNRQLIERCNDTVTEQDRLIMLGDNVMGTWAENIELLKQLRAGEIILFPGNHDKWAMTYKNSPERQERFRDLMRAVDPRIKVIEDRKPHGWSHLLPDETHVLLSHYPYIGDSQHDDRHADMRPRDDGLPLIHGHVHNAWKVSGRQVNVGVDVWDFAPVNEADLVPIVQDMLSA